MHTCKHERDSRNNSLSRQIQKYTMYVLYRLPVLGVVQIPGTLGKIFI